MTLQDIIADIHALTEDLEVYERKYGVLSETFYEFYSSGEQPENEAWVLDWTDWAGAYQILLRGRLGWGVSNFVAELIPRFAYNFGACNTPPLERISKHIEQLTPVLRTNSDIIAFIQAGFIGKWGEWHFYGCKETRAHLINS